MCTTLLTTSVSCDLAAEAFVELHEEAAAGHVLGHGSMSVG